MQLGLVDLDAAIVTQVAALAQACEVDGFFRIPVTVVEPEIRAGAWAAASAFFALPEAEKMKIAFPEPGYPYGYSRFGFESLARSTGDETARPDLKESLSVGPDCGAAPRSVRNDGEEWIRSPSLWPKSQPELRPVWETYYRALSEVAARLMSVMALALELPANYFESMIDRPITSMRAIRYPKIDDPPAGSLRAGAHADYGTLTILQTDDVAGLEILRDGQWAAVEPDPETLVVNLGDSVAQWTNDRWPSTMHRVTNSGPARQSLAFFHMANWDATIQCLPGCRRPDEPPRYAAVQAGPWLMRKFQSTVG